jgi:hypothetical protein
MRRIATHLAWPPLLLAWFICCWGGCPAAEPTGAPAPNGVTYEQATDVAEMFRSTVLQSSFYAATVATFTNKDIAQAQQRPGYVRTQIRGIDDLDLMHQLSVIHLIDAAYNKTDKQERGGFFSYSGTDIDQSPVGPARLFYAALPDSVRAEARQRAKEAAAHWPMLLRVAAEAVSAEGAPGPEAPVPNDPNTVRPIAAVQKAYKARALIALDLPSLGIDGVADERRLAATIASLVGGDADGLRARLTHHAGPVLTQPPRAFPDAIEARSPEDYLYMARADLIMHVAAAEPGMAAHVMVSELLTLELWDELAQEAGRQAQEHAAQRAQDDARRRLAALKRAEAKAAAGGPDGTAQAARRRGLGPELGQVDQRLADGMALVMAAQYPDDPAYQESLTKGLALLREALAALIAQDLSNEPAQSRRIRDDMVVQICHTLNRRDGQHHELDRPARLELVRQNSLVLFKYLDSRLEFDNGVLYRISDACAAQALSYYERIRTMDRDLPASALRDRFLVVRPLGNHYRVASRQDYIKRPDGGEQRMHSLIPGLGVVLDDVELAQEWSRHIASRQEEMSKLEKTIVSMASFTAPALLDDIRARYPGTTFAERARLIQTGRRDGVVRE